MDERIWHYVRPQGTARIPRRHVFLDTEARTLRVARGHKQIWRVGAAAYHSAEKGRATTDALRTYRDPRSLWTDVSEFTKPRNRTVLWCHNLGYDLRIADAFRALPALGWSLAGHNLANRGTWLQWTRAGATLLMVDSASVFPVPLAQLATSFMQAKVPLPGDDAPADEWERRVVRDVEILRDAILAYLAWIEKEGLGSWQMTGAGQGFAAFRARHMTHAMLVHDDPGALVAERRAMWTGRCEAYWKGNTGHVGIEEWDYSLSYARLARDHELPTHYLGPADPDTSLHALLSRRHTAILARVEVETTVPTTPAEVDGRVAWPVGRFETVLWDPELRLAIESGASVRVIEAWRYQTSRALKQWGEWIIDALAADNPHTTPWQRIIYKHWSRALIGRFGMQYTKWSKVGTSQEHRVLYTTVYDVASGEEYQLTHLGDAIVREDGTVEWAQSQPAITGYIMSLSRVQLWRLVQAMPKRAVLYVDTDSLYIRSAHHRAAVALARSDLGEGLRLKHTYTRAHILGPRQVIVDGRARIAGIPTKAELRPDLTLQGEVWSSLEQTLRRGDPSAVITTPRVWKVSGIDHRRVAGQNGWTDPVAISQGE